MHPNEIRKISEDNSSTLESKVDIKMKPKPPNFKTTLARTIEPKTGASTWALGSHICKKKTGIFTNKETKAIKFNIVFKILEFVEI